MASDHCFAWGDLAGRSELRQGHKILIACLNQKATRKESVAGEDDDHGELKEAGVHGMASDAEQIPTRKIAILDNDSRDLGSIGMAATTTFLAWGENDRCYNSPMRGGRERESKIEISGERKLGIFLIFYLAILF